MKKEMLINVAQPEECRIAIVEDGVLEELYVERASQESYVGNIYKGRIVNIEPSIQAAFVDFGIGRNGFLHVSDVDPVYYKHLLPRDVVAELEAEEDGGPPPSRDRGGRGGRDRDRGGRGGRDRDRDRGDRDRDREPRPMTSWLPAEPAAPPPPEYVDEVDEGGFGAGLLEGDAGAGVEEEYEVVEEAEETGEPAGHPAAAAAAPARRVPPPPPPEPADPDESGFGAGLLDDEPPAPRQEPAAAGPAEVIELTETEIELTSPAAAEPTADDSGFGAEPEEPAAEPKAEAEPEAKKPTRARRSRKKADGDDAPETSDGGEAGPDDKPRTMPGAERRTAPPGDEPEIESSFGAGLDDSFGAGLTDEPAKPADDAGEPEVLEGEAEADGDDGAEVGFDDEEVQPFFPGPADDFDVAGPNDRFTGGAPERERERPRRPRKEPAPAAALTDDETGPAGDEDEGSFGGEAEAAAVAAVEEEEEDFTPPGFDEAGEGDGGGRGGRDRGPRSRGRDRRPGGRGGPGGGGGRPAPRDRGTPGCRSRRSSRRGRRSSSR